MPRTARQKIIKKLDDLVRKAIRLRDDDTCQRCGKKVYGSNSQPSHVIPKSRCLYLRYNLLNVKLLCNPCHRWWHNNPVVSGIWFKESYPARYAYITSAEHIIAKWKMDDYRRIQKELEEKIEDLK